MNPQTWRSMRWLVALGACTLVVVVSVPLAFDALTKSVVFGDGDGDGDGEREGEEAASDGTVTEPTGQVPVGAVSDGEAVAETDVVVAGGTVTRETDDELAIEDEGDAVVIVFPLIDGSADCVAGAELQVAVVEAQETELAVYAGQAAIELADDAEVGDPRRDSTVHSLALTDGTPGRLRWDVTDLYRAWAAGELAAAGAAFTVVIAPPDDAAAVTFAASESDEGPSLSWDGEAGCGE